MIKYFMIFVLLFSVVGNAEDQWLNLYENISGKKTKKGYVHISTSHYKKKGKERIKIIEIIHLYVPELGRVEEFAKEVSHLDKKYRLKSKKTTEFHGEKIIVRKLVKKNSIKIITIKNGHVSNSFLEKKRPVYAGMDTHVIAKKAKMKVGAKGKFDILSKEEIFPYTYEVLKKKEISIALGNFSTYVVKFQGEGLTGKIFCKSNGDMLKGNISNIKAPNIVVSFEETTKDDAKKKVIIKKTNEIKVFSSDKKRSILLPSGFKEKELIAGADIQGIDQRRDIGFVIFSESKEVVSVDLNTYSKLIVAQLEKVILNPKVSSKLVSIANKSGIETELSGKINGTEITFLVTIIESVNDFSQVRFWTTKSAFPTYKPLMQKITQSFESE